MSDVFRSQLSLVHCYVVFLTGKFSLLSFYQHIIWFQRWTNGWQQRKVCTTSGKMKTRSHDDKPISLHWAEGSHWHPASTECWPMLCRLEIKWKIFLNECSHEICPFRRCQYSRFIVIKLQKEKKTEKIERKMSGGELWIDDFGLNQPHTT